MGTGEFLPDHTLERRAEWKALKEEAGRDQDRIDVTALRMAHGLEE